MRFNYLVLTNMWNEIQIEIELLSRHLNRYLLTEIQIYLGEMNMTVPT